MIALYIILFVYVLQSVWTILVYNDFVKRKLLVDNNFSQIKIQCMKRYDLVPNLVETVKGFAAHETAAFENVIAALNTGASANSPETLGNADKELKSTLAKLFAIIETHPELMASGNLANMQNQLVNIENAIAISRQFYNDAAMMYNRKIVSFPNNLFARVFRFKQAEFFDTSDGNTESVKISFN